jgi:hypothetical protein
MAAKGPKKHKDQISGNFRKNASPLGLNLMAESRKTQLQNERPA